MFSLYCWSWQQFFITNYRNLLNFLGKTMFLLLFLIIIYLFIIGNTYGVELSSGSVLKNSFCWSMEY